MKPQDFIKEGHIVDDAHAMHQDHEVQMAREECYHAAKTAIELHQLLKGVSEMQGLDGWVSEKIAIAYDYLKTVYEYLDYELRTKDTQMPPIAFAESFGQVMGEAGIIPAAAPRAPVAGAARAAPGAVKPAMTTNPAVPAQPVTPAPPKLGTPPANPAVPAQPAGTAVDPIQQKTDQMQQSLLDRMGKRFGLPPGSTMDQVQAAQQAHLDKNDPAAAAQYKQNMSNVDAGNTAANKPVTLKAPPTTPAAPGATPAAGQPSADDAGGMAAAKAGKSPIAIMLAQPTIGNNQAMLDVIAPTLGLPAGSSVQQILAADDARNAKAGNKYAAAPAPQPVAEVAERSVDSKGRTQRQWIQAVKSKFPDARIVQAKMIDGPCHAILPDGRKISWSKAEQHMDEIKKGQKDSNGYTRCWPSKHAEGTKKGKNGGQVRNCQPNESVDEALEIELNALMEFASGMGAGSVAIAPGVGRGSKVGSLFGGSYSQTKSPFKKKTAKKESVIKR